MELKSKLYLVDQGGNKFMGIGVLWLLENVQEHGSLRAACKAMGISYSKAFGMVSELEKNLGTAVLERRHGGAGREGAVLTKFGQDFVKEYDAFQKEAKQALEAPYATFQRKVDELLRQKGDQTNAKG